MPRSHIKDAGLSAGPETKEVSAREKMVLVRAVDRSKLKSKSSAIGKASLWMDP